MLFDSIMGLFEVQAVLRNQEATNPKPNAELFCTEIYANDTGKTYIHTYMHTYPPTNISAGRPADKQTDQRTDESQTDGRTDGQIDRRTGRPSQPDRQTFVCFTHRG